jgi:hypothetical protein
MQSITRATAFNRTRRCPEMKESWSAPDDPDVVPEAQAAAAALG